MRGIFPLAFFVKIYDCFRKVFQIYITFHGVTWRVGNKDNLVCEIVVATSGINRPRDWTSRAFDEHSTDDGEIDPGIFGVLYEE